MPITYLRKSSDEVVSHCSCGDGRVTFPPQMDCPWCGCGWLFTCITCRQAFAFAEGVELDTTWEALAREDLLVMLKEEPDAEDIRGWVEVMQVLLDEVEPSERYVIIDGWVLPTDSRDVVFEGWHARHAFARLPQMAALEDPAALDADLANRAYWEANAVGEG